MPDHRKYHSPLDGHCYKDSYAEPSKLGRPYDYFCPSSAGSSQRDLNTPIPK